MLKEEYHTLFLDFVNSRERAYAPKFQKELDNQVKQYFIDKSIHNEGMFQILKSLYFDAAKIYARRMRVEFDKVKASGQMGFLNSFIQAFSLYFDMQLRNLAQKINETTLFNIETFINRKLKEGYNLREVANNIGEALEINKMRAVRIARTETTSSANAASYFSAINAGYEMQKEWLATDDTRTRKTHGHDGVEGTRINLEDTFKVGNYRLLYPGDKGTEDGQLPVGAEEVVNCRCTLIYHAKRDSRGRLILI